MEHPISGWGKSPPIHWFGVYTTTLAPACRLPAGGSGLRRDNGRPRQVSELDSWQRLAAGTPIRREWDGHNPMKRPLLLLCVLSAGFAPLARPQKQPLRWTEQQANDWYRNQPWLVGANYIPSTAINELEMWQADTFDPQRIDLELGWAESIGMNTMRVFLHDLLWKQDAAGFRQRIDTFLTIAARHHIRPMFVLFDSCWNPNPRLGKQPSPKQLRELIQKAKSEKARIIFVQPQFDRHSAQAVADAIGGRIVPINDMQKDILTNLQDMTEKIGKAFEETRTEH